MMSWNPNLIFYACIAKGTTILAEFNSKDADLADLAVKCLEKTPPLHTTFSHTVRAKTNMFLIDDPFVYFGIFDQNLDNSEGLSFLNSVKDEFNNVVGSNPEERLDTFNSHCFQGEFNPVFHQLLSSNLDFEIPQSPRVADSRGQRIGSMPLLAADLSSKSLKKKKKNRFFAETNRGSEENKVDVMSHDDVSLMHHKNGSDSQKAKRIWKKQVLVVLSLDLVVCCALFAIWLWVCSGFRCIAR